MTDADCHADVIVVGSGPTGSAAALALAGYGVRSLTVSRWNWLANTPRAHIINQRTMEVFRDLGVLDDVLRDATPWDRMGDMMFTTSLAGEEVMRINAWGSGDDRRGDYIKASPCGMVDLIQPDIEPILLRRAAERGAAFALNTEYLRHEQDADGVTVHLRDRLAERDYALRCKYLIGADGARSAIVEQEKLAIEGEMARAGTAYVIFNADLSRYVAHRPSTLHWIVTPHASFGEIGMGLLRNVRPWSQWIAGWGFDIGAGEPDLSDAAVREKIYAMIGDDTVPVEIVRGSCWYVNQAYATQYSRGRVFCAGDAVHRHPPSSGLGLNTCVQDAFNLAWKLAYVLKGYAGAGLLDSYSSERAPVGKQIVLRANQSRKDYAPIHEILRIEDAANPVLAGLERLKSPSAEGVRARAAMNRALALKDTEFNAQGVELNQRYVSQAVIPDPTGGEEQWRVDPVTHVQATTRPGAKIPHAWLVNRSGHRVSTLDVTGKGLMTVVTGLAGTAWVEACARLSLPYLRCVAAGQGDALDLYFEWARAREVAEAGALIVRPDGYVAWRQMNAVHDPDDARRQLEQALAQILSQDGVGAPYTQARRAPDTAQPPR